MHEVQRDPSPELVAKRRELGIDRRDEVWDGVLHMVPPPLLVHQLVAMDVHRLLRQLLEPAGCLVTYETGVFGDAGQRDFRVPDIVVALPSNVSARGVERRAELVVEVLSPGDLSRRKLGFYARCGVAEAWLIEPATREIEVYVLRESEYVIAMPDDTGVILAPRFGLSLAVVGGPRLRVTWRDGSGEI